MNKAIPYFVYFFMINMKAVPICISHKWPITNDNIDLCSMLRLKEDLETMSGFSYKISCKIYLIVCILYLIVNMNKRFMIMLS